MLMRPWPKSARLGIKAAFALGILAAVLLPMSRAERKQSPPTAIQSNAAISAVYRGKSAEAWFEQADLHGDSTRREFVEAMAAFREMGGAAVPFLREKLAPAQTPAVSARTVEIRKRAAWTLKELGPVAEPAVPELIVALED